MPTVNERLADEAVRHAVYFDRYSTGVVRRLIALLNRTNADLRAQIVIALERMPAESFTVERLESLLYSVRDLNKQAYESVGLELTKELREFSAYEIGYQQDLFKHVLPVQISFNTVVAEQVYSAALARPFQGRLLAGWASKIEADRMERIRNSIRLGYVEGQSTSQIVQRIMGTRAKGYEDGVIEIDRRNARAVVQTALSHTAGFAKDRFHEANKDLIAAVKWLSTLDGRTSEGCRLRDGLKYENETHKPIGHKVPWLSGPGRLHWNAVCEGTLITTDRGPMPVESVEVGDIVLTHNGRFSPVTTRRSKHVENGVVRVIHTESGRVLRASDDHPILVSGGGWKFVGALEVGDSLFCDPKELREVAWAKSAVDATSEDCPASLDKTDVAIKRALQFVAPDVDFECDKEVWSSEVENCAINLVLCDPPTVEDQSRLHHLLSLADALKKLGCYGFGYLLSHMVRDGGAGHSFPHPFVEAGFQFGVERTVGDAGHMNRIIDGHALGVSGHSRVRFLGQPPRPMGFAGRSSSLTGDEIVPHLLLLGSDRDVVALCVAGEAPVGESMPSLDGAQRVAGLDMFIDDDGAKSGVIFGHDRILSLEVQTYNSTLYDLEVADDCSYIASGIVVSNCRSTSSPVTKSWKELGIDIEEMSPGTRASMSGQVPTDMTYADWLKKQPAGRQDDVLGVTRAKLFRDGGLTMDRFYSDRGQYLTLDELRARDAAAFTKAGL